MKKLLVILSVLLLVSFCGLVACGGKSEVEKGYDACVKSIEDRAYDPSSVMIKTAEAVDDTEGSYIYYKIYYNAKNRLGAYVGYSYEYLAYEKETKEIYAAKETTYNIHEALTRGGGTNKYYKLKG